MRVLGVDENGLGPRLGPLVATAVLVEVSTYDAKKLARAAARVGVGDSKQTSAHGQMKAAEGVALAIAERVSGQVPHDLDALLAAVSIDGSLALRAPCPHASTPQCWGERVPLPAFGGDVAEGRASLAALAKRGVVVRRARSAIACVKVFNREVERRGSKLSVDLELFERLILDARATCADDLLAICGMVGGIRKYRDFFARIDASAITEAEESRERSRYRVDGVGEIVFEVDSDAHHLPVALASMLGKYVRELAMERQTRFYRGHDTSLPVVSGYHDPVTRRFVEASAALRASLAIADDCFERRG